MKENLNWVSERRECSLAKIFEKLRQEVTQDVNERQRMRRPTSDRGSTYGYDYEYSIVENADEFTVLLEFGSISERVTFVRDETEIRVMESGGGLMLKAIPSINVEGKCIVRIKGQEHPLWYMRMIALAGCGKTGARGCFWVAQRFIAAITALLSSAAFSR